VASVAVLGVPDPTRDEQVAAFVRLAPGVHVDEAELFAASSRPTRHPRCAASSTVSR
jgi:acyl-coenzyme A synthetase/AMP-(fatty) acid ligase